MESWSVPHIEPAYNMVMSQNSLRTRIPGVHIHVPKECATLHVTMAPAAIPQAADGTCRKSIFWIHVLFWGPNLPTSSNPQLASLQEFSKLVKSPKLKFWMSPLAKWFTGRIPCGNQYRGNGIFSILDKYIYFFIFIYIYIHLNIYIYIFIYIMM